MDSIFDCIKEPYKIKKPIRLIELFAGIGSQSMALRDLNKDFEIYKVVEFDKYAIASYNAIHETNFPTLDITQVKGKDLDVKDTNKYDYIMTYSFPCQDLSVVGYQKGMQKHSGTRSGLLWEVERLLNEMNELPQILLMENVVQVHSKSNIKDFNSWISFLESKGYKNFIQDLNAKDFGIPQNRKRCFMVSILGDYSYNFPTPQILTKNVKSILEKNVDEKYYIKNDRRRRFLSQLLETNQIQNITLETVDFCLDSPKLRDIANCIIARVDCGISNQKSVGTGVVEKINNVSNSSLSINDYKVRKLTPLECWRLMGFTDNDFYRASSVNSNCQLYKQAGNSIVKNVLMAIFNQLF